MYPTKFGKGLVNKDENGVEVVVSLGGVEELESPITDIPDCRISSRRKAIS